MDEPVVTEPTSPSEPVPVSDPFTLDESKLATIPPEYRQAITPVFEEWKTRAKAELDKAEKTYGEKYKPQVEKAEALDMLVKDQRFVQWWQAIQRTAAQVNPQGSGAAAQAKPQDFATPDEWQNALSDAYTGNPGKLQEIQQRMFSVMATPVVQQLRQGQDELRTTLAMKDLFDRHEDAAELDRIGRNVNDPNDQSESLLESCLNWADANGKTLEEGYMRAKSWADSLRVGAKQEAMGLVQDKKKSVTSGPSTNQAGTGVVEVADADELALKHMEAVASGQKPPRFVIRPKAAPSETRWVQRA